MQRVEKTIFISYRRTNAAWALNIFQNLTGHGYDVFYDYEKIASGDFDQVIVGNIKARAHFLIVLTPSALERCDDPNDWLRREIETAIDTRRNVVPLMLDNFDFGTPEVAKRLTGKLAAVKKYNGLRVPTEYFFEAMDRLRQNYLNIPLDAVLQPPSETVQKAAEHQQAAARGAPPVRQEELTAQQWFERGYEASEPDEKVRCYSEAIRLDPENADAYNNRGNARREKDDLDGAVSDYNEAIRVNPKYAIAYNNRGNVRKAKGDLDGAISDYNEATRLNPEYVNAYYNRGNTLIAKGDLDGAISDYNEAIRLNPKYANAYYNRGIVRKDKGDLDGAISDYNEAILLDPAYADAYYNRGLILEQAKKYVQAFVDLQKYLELGGGKRDGDQADVEKRINQLKQKSKQRSGGSRRAKRSPKG
jgi:tetratricopeptide (TPR) repeat protein